MAFEFSFESLLRHRARIEEMARREFLEAQAIVQGTLNEIDKMYQRIDEVRNQISEEQQGNNTNLIQQLEAFIEGQKIRIEMKRLEARQQMEVAEEKQDILTERAKEHKSLKKLKAKKYAEFKKAQKKKEAKNIEDMVTMRFRRSYGQ